MHICCDFLEWWEMASDADKVFYRKHLFTQRSPMGKPIFVDRAVEWTMRHIRMYLGKYARTNQDERLDRVVADIPFRTAARRDLRALSWRENNLDMYSSMAFNLQTVAVSKVCIKTYLKARRSNLWGVGELGGDFDHEDDGHFDDRPFGFPIIGEEGLQPMSASYLSAYQTGENRVKEYYKKWHIQFRHPEKREGIDETLKLIPSQSSVRREAIKKMGRVKLSTSVEELKNLAREFPKADIKRDLDHLRETHYPQIPLVKLREIQREPLLELLCKWRKRYFNDFPGVYEEHCERSDAVEMEDNHTDIESRTEELKHFIFALEPDIVDEFRT